MKLPTQLDWKVRAAIDLIVAVAFIATMYSQGAPTWALTLVLYLATKPSRVALAGDLAAIQTTLRVGHDKTILGAGESDVSAYREES